MSSDDYAVYGDSSGPAGAGPGGGVPDGALPACPVCGSTDREDGFVEGTGDSLVRYYASPREVGLFGVRRMGLERRAVVARRCLGCSRLDLFAVDPD